MSARSRLVVVLIAIVVGVAVLRAAGPALADSSTSAPTAAPGAPVIRHVIVIVQSHHSFDNYFGTRAGADGLPKGVCERASAGSQPCVSPSPLGNKQSLAGLNDSAAATSRAIDGGKMDGFVMAQGNRSSGSVAMGHYDRSTLGYYWSLADHYTLFDHFFSASADGSFANRTFAIAGQAGPAVGTPPTNGFDLPTVFDRLQSSGISWKYYIQNYEAARAHPSVGEEVRAPLLSMPRVMADPAMARQVVDVQQYYQDVRTDTLPGVSYIVSSGDSERPPEKPARGEAFVRSLLNALMQSGAWARSAVILTYDDSGGWYDHVPPPTITPNGSASSGLAQAQADQQLGLRVPTLLISPFAKASYVDHEQTDTTSILRFIEQNWNLAPLTARDATAANLTGALNLNQAPHPAAVVTPNPAPSVVRPHVTSIYLAYVGALAVGALVVSAALFSDRRRRRRIPEIDLDPAGSFL